jgi:hypothetical protein
MPSSRARCRFFYAGDDGNLHETTWDGSAWVERLMIPDTRIRGTPSAAVHQGVLHVFYNDRLTHTLELLQMSPSSWIPVSTGFAMSEGADPQAYVEGSGRTEVFTAASTASSTRHTGNGSRWLDVAVSHQRLAP